MKNCIFSQYILVIERSNNLREQLHKFSILIALHLYFVHQFQLEFPTSTECIQQFCPSFYLHEYRVSSTTFTRIKSSIKCNSSYQANTCQIHSIKVYIIKTYPTVHLLKLYDNSISYTKNILAVPSYPVITQIHWLISSSLKLDNESSKLKNRGK